MVVIEPTREAEALANTSLLPMSYHLREMKRDSQALSSSDKILPLWR